MLWKARLRSSREGCVSVIKVMVTGAYGLIGCVVYRHLQAQPEGGTI